MKNALKHIAVLFLFALVTCLWLYPLPAHLASGLLEAQSGDPLMQIWVIQWNIHKLTTSLTHYFDANIFYPYLNTFAYHDHMFALGVLGLPIYVVSHNPILTYNLLLLLSFILSAYGMFLLCRELTGNSYAALFAGLIFGFLPYRFAHLDHLNLLSTQWFPFCFLFLTRYLFLHKGTPSKVVRNLALFWGFFTLQALTSFNYLFMLTFAVGIFIVVTMFFQWKMYAYLYVFHSKRNIVAFVIGGCIVGMLLLPFILPYFRANQEMGFQRTLREAESLSARVQDYFVAPDNNLFYGQITRKWQSATSPFPREQILFGGILPIVLAALGIFGGWKRRRLHSQVPHRAIFHLSYLVLLVMAGLLSLGPSTTLSDKTFPLPYLWLYNVLPGFNSMRVPARFSVLVFFAMAILAAIGITQLYEYLKRSRWHHNPRLNRILLTGILGGILCLEYASLSKELRFYPATMATIPPVYRWLAQQPEGTHTIELPLESAKANFEYTYYSTFHWKRMINGRSAFIPDGIWQIFSEMRNFPSQNSIDLLKSLGIHYVILHTETFPRELPETFPEGIQLVRAFEKDLLFAITKSPGIWQNSGNFTTESLNIRYYLPARLRPDEQHTMGVSIRPAHFPFCPVPHERANIDVTWKTPTQQVVYKGFGKITLPLVFQRDEEQIFSVRLSTPSEAGDYQVVLHVRNPLIIPSSTTEPVTIASDLRDSRHPGELRAQFLRVDIPNIWESGRALPVRIVVKNIGDTLWKARASDRKSPVGEVHLAVVDWQDLSSGTSLKHSHQQLFLSRGFLPYDVAPGEEVLIAMKIHTPENVGEYMIQFDMVSELIQWFSNQGSELLTRKILLK